MNCHLAEMLSSYIHETLLPPLVKQREKELRANMELHPGEKFTVDALLEENGLSKLAIPTVYRWIRRLGFKYQVRKKCYYVDTHEKPENQRYRKDFIRQYRKLEMRMHRWIQFTIQEFETICATNPTLREELNSPGFCYDPEGSGSNTHIEFHVDDHSLFQATTNNEHFGGRLSFLNPKPDRPLICFGQDESIFRQYIFSNKAWVAPDGTSALIPKDEGLGLMVSAFVSREFGFGLKLSEEELVRVNNFRRQPEHLQYLDEDAAKQRLGSIEKKDINESPFVKLFEYGANKDGYWNYEWMVIQTEDCIDVLQALYPQYDYVFMFDHSSGHDRQRSNGLNANSTNKSFGGAQPKMRDTMIESPDQLGCKGVPTLSLGDTQSLVFVEGDAGPCWMTPEDQLVRKFDSEDAGGATLTYKFNKAELVSKLEAKSLPTNGQKRHLQERCIEHFIPIQEQRKKIIEGWLHKPKGMLQILWERGFLDSGTYKGKAIYDAYTVGGKKHRSGAPIEGSGLFDLMSSQPDFVNEITLLQYFTEQRSLPAGCQLTIIRSPKCHPELAGEGIEYDWAAAKQFYRRQKLKDKRTKDKFGKLVIQSLDQVKMNLRIEFSRRARQYMLAYQTVESFKKDPRAAGKNFESSAHLLDSVVKERKSHRTVSQDGSWVGKMLQRMKEKPVHGDVDA